MASSFIVGKHVICKVRDRDNPDVINEGAVYQRDGSIVDVGKYDDLKRRYEADEVLGSLDHVVLPGFVNGHHHLGLTPFQLGSPDLPLELWIASRLRKRDIDPYLDTLFSAFEMIRSGVTTVQHLHSWVPGPRDNIRKAADAVIQAYQDVGMRVSYSFLLRDQNRIVYGPDADFVASLPPALAAGMGEYLDALTIPLAENFALFEELHRSYASRDRTQIQLAPANLHWCSDEALEMVADYSMRFNAPVHIHLLETVYQREYARRRTQRGAVRHLQKLGLLGPRVTIGHGVWLSQDDIELLADTDTRICHNCSSNLRLQSGIAPVSAFDRKGLKVAIGIDESGINEDRDMLQEMRLVFCAHRTPGMDSDVLTSTQVFRMATEHGAQTTPYGSMIGTLEPGRAADLVVMNWEHIAYPYLDGATSPLDAVLYRGRAAGVETVLVGGKPILRDRRFTTINKEAILEKLHRSLQASLSDHEIKRREYSDEVTPYVRRFYDDYLRSEWADPFYRYNSRS